MDTVNPERHLARRVRHETRKRQLTVRSIEDLTPHMRRIVFDTDTMEGFASLAPDDHIKLFFDDAGGQQMRDFTPRRFDVGSGTLVIDFALHDAGPATAFAAAARPGDRLEIGGPRGSAVVADDFDWYWLIGDETAIPAIARHLQALPAPTRGVVLIEIADRAEEQALTLPAGMTLTWLHRNGAEAGRNTLLLDAIRAVAVPENVEGCQFWLGAEAATAHAVRALWRDELHLPRRAVRALAYWHHDLTETSE